MCLIPGNTKLTSLQDMFKSREYETNLNADVFKPREYETNLTARCV